MNVPVTPISLHAVQARLNGAAKGIITHPVRRWAGWVSYLLEVLEDELPAGERDDFLNSVAREINTRLKLGRW